jgi:hypothetical protein
MKVTIRKYPAWVGPYQLVEKIFFWARQKDEYGIEREADWVYSIGDWLAHTWFGGWWSGVSYNWTHYHGKRQVKVRIDYWDTWSMDHTLGYIVLPMLKQLKATKHGSPMIDDADVPHLPKQGRASNESMQADLFDSDEHDQLCWKQYEERWEWVINEIIFAFESLVGNNEDWEDKYWTGESDIYWDRLNDGMSEMKRGPNDTREWDKEGHTKEGERIRNGFRLFGTYYTALWD